MKRLNIFIISFFIAISIPLLYFVTTTYNRLQQEEYETLRFFAGTLFEEIEKKLGEMIVKEENRAIDEYNIYYYAEGSTNKTRSPLSEKPEQSFILGYLQINPDGSIQSPMESIDDHPSSPLSKAVMKLREVNESNHLKDADSLKEHIGQDKKEQQEEAPLMTKKEDRSPVFARKYIDYDKNNKKKAYLGQTEKRKKKISADQAINIVQPGLRSEKTDVFESDAISSEVHQAPLPYPDGAAAETFFEPGIKPALFSQKIVQAEIAPFQSVFISDREMFIFRRVIINDRIFRQGFIIILPSFLAYLSETCFESQPMSTFTGLDLSLIDSGKLVRSLKRGNITENAKEVLKRNFPRPFSFLNARITYLNTPKSENRDRFTAMVIITAVVMLTGFFAIQRSARTIEEMAERRQAFASSVTHELKTPLTNIRLYIEMLENGMARSMNKEAAYLKIIRSESDRLTRLIHNVLEFSKLERKKWTPTPVSGNFNDVLHEVKTAMQEKIDQEGFSLNIRKEGAFEAEYDREVMAQILINLIENSIKFGESSKTKNIDVAILKKKDAIHISVSDDGPGIPEKSLDKIFEEFYRVDGSLARTTSGTGIGLSLVKKYVTALDGKIWAENNQGPGCTIHITFPDHMES